MNEKEIVKDGLKLKTLWKIYKWKDENDEVSKFLQQGGSIAQAIKAFGEPFGIEEIQGNIALHEGLDELIDLICGVGTPVKWDNTNAYLGVGDSSTAEADTQTGLQAATNKLYKAMDATYPQKATQIAEWRSTFGSADANWAWEEYSVSNTSGGDSGKNLNRKIGAKGTKVAGESWTLSLKITFS